MWFGASMKTPAAPWRMALRKLLSPQSGAVSPSLHQTRIYSEIVSEQPKPVAYFFVDAMRFEMGVELSERLPKSVEVSVRPAICALPSITPIGMAALQPGASSSFSVVEQAGTLGATIDDAFLPDLTARKKFAASRVPRLADIALDELLSLQRSRLAKKIEGAQVIIVRSQEIDHAGERGFTFQARQVMDTVIDNLARAIRKLAAASVEHCVLTADHGHLFFPSDRDESMRIDPPGGNEIDLHRRCWIGRGGATPAGCVRVTASALGYGSDLDFVLPIGSGVFKAGGDLAFHHGGPSLQEMVIPVVTVRMKARETERANAGPVTATGLPDAVTNRIFSVTIQIDGKNLSLFPNELVVRPLLISAGKQVGGVGMAVDGDFDRATGCVKLHAGKPVTVAFLLSDESSPSLPGGRSGSDNRRRAVPFTHRYSGSSRSLSMSNGSPPTRDALDNKANHLFAGKVVRKDLVRKVKVGANVPVFVLEFLLGKYCASSDEIANPDGIAGRQRHVGKQLHSVRRVCEGAKQGQGKRKMFLHRQGEGPAGGFGLLGPRESISTTNFYTSRANTFAITSAC